jgi:hypothetical protein
MIPSGFIEVALDHIEIGIMSNLHVISSRRLEGKYYFQTILAIIFGAPVEHDLNNEQSIQNMKQYLDRVS